MWNVRNKQAKEKEKETGKSRNRLLIYREEMDGYQSGDGWGG